MSRTINATLQTRLDSGSTNLCHIFTVTRRDGTIKRFTDLNTDLVFSGNTYLSTDSLSVSAITSSTNNGIQSTNCGVIFSSSGISEIDVVRGLYDNTIVELAIVDYTDTSLGKIVLLTGTLSVINIGNKKQGQFEINGMLSRGDRRIGEYYSAQCRADLGDARCGISLAAFTDTGSVSFVTSPSVFRIDLAGNPANNYYDFGVITFTSGLNSGLSMEVQSQYAFNATEDALFLPLPMPYTVQVGDTFSIVAGCDKRSITCRTKFNNIVNFRGEPFVPGSDVINDLKKL
jgi:uncharacterized phage protein (TIGR02218 family)